MRFKLLLQVNKRAFGNLLPINYQYEQSAAIYKILALLDKAYASWLHDNGFRLENGKTFKLFTYSRFKIEKRRVFRDKERLQILSDTIEWQIGFLPERSTEAFIQGIFQDQILYYRSEARLNAIDTSYRDLLNKWQVETQRQEFYKTLRETDKILSDIEVNDSIVKINDKELEILDKNLSIQEQELQLKMIQVSMKNKEALMQQDMLNLQKQYLEAQVLTEEARTDAEKAYAEQARANATKALWDGCDGPEKYR